MPKNYIHPLIILLLFVTGCSSSCSNDSKQNKNTVAEDLSSPPPPNSLIDSLLHMCTHTPADTTLAMLYYQIAETYKHNDLEKAKEYYLKLGELSEQLNWQHGRYLFTKNFTLMLVGRESLQSNLTR
jgi:hypothetical protein